MKNIIFVILLSMFAFMACSENMSSSDTGSGLISDRQTAPSFSLNSVTYNNTNNGTISLSSLKGKVVYLFFLGYSCPTCVASAPDTKTINGSYDSDDVVVLGLDVWNGSSGQVANFITQTGIKYPVLTQAGSVGTQYGAYNDYSVVVDKDGKIAFKGGGVNEDAIRSVIDELLTE
jgi:peroxiredoxin